ncbi:hypothetical protein LSTR_LSTR010103 [Laodelphax striatellus]|uniref:Uncharacterized protein n=1 Tax=Laodelphax striatellus TaxID=195883 RepID=A0A482X4F5_LAOST|nr:hypothetical protein LSTR_LSTR010103 [Laodelphax striatellus]
MCHKNLAMGRLAWCQIGDPRERELVPDVDVRLGFDFLKIQGANFHWSADMKLMSGKEDGLARLKSMLRVDLANFVSRLKEESG